MRTLYVAASICFLLIGSGCSTSSIKENINKTGDAAGQAIGEFASGVSTGVKKAIEPKIELTDDLKNKGIALGKTVVSSDSLGKDNILVAYIIFNSDYTGTITAKAFDNKNLEIGRVKQPVKARKDETQYLEFRFDKRTDIDNDSRIALE